MRILITVPWAQRLGGAEAMLQGILDGAAESPHELEVVFLEHGPWADELAGAGLRCGSCRRAACARSFATSSRSCGSRACSAAAART